MIKHADSLNWWQTLRQAQEARRKDKRDDELAPAWWTNALAPEAAMVPNTANMLSLFKPINYNHYTRNADEIRDIIGHTGLDVETLHKPDTGMNEIFPSAQNYAYAGIKPGRKLNKLEQMMSGLSEQPPTGKHGLIMKMMGDSDQWHIPALAHELGHAQEEHTMGALAKGIQHARPLGAIGNIAASIEGFRALSNKARPLAERKQMLDRASLMGGAGSLPTLINEYRASRNGMNILRKMPLTNTPEMLAEARRMLPRAYSTYALAALAPVVAPQIAKMFLPQHVD